MRAIDFVYCPLMSDTDCAFRVEGKGGKRGKKGTYRQCERIGRTEIQGYRFCELHAKQVQKEIGE